MYEDYIGQITNQTQFSYAILRNLTSSNSGSVPVVESPAGTGKTTLAKKVVELWKSQDEKNSCIFINSDKSHGSPNAYGPFMNLIMEEMSDTKAIVGNVLSESSKDIPLFGNTISSLLANLFSKKQMINQFSEQELGIVKMLERLVSKKRTLVVFEDVNAWSEESISLMVSLVNNSFKKAFIQQLSFLITTTAFEGTVKNIEKPTTPYRLNPIAKDDIPKVMAYFNRQTAGTISENQISSLFRLTGGNLKLLKEVSSNEYLIDSSLEENDLYEVISNRIASETPEAKDIIELLKKASVIGSIARIVLLREFSKNDFSNFRKVLDYSVKLELLLVEHDQDVKFADSIIYRSVLSSLKEDKVEYHLLLEKCINILYPSSYKLRAAHLLNGGSMEQAAILYIIHMIQCYRDQGKKLLEPVFLNGTLAGHPYLKFYEAMLKGYELYFNGKYDAANGWIFEQDEVIPEFIFEIDYLKALICTNWHYAESDFEEGRIFLEKWVHDSSFKSTHLEMWLRASMLLLDYYYELNRKDEGKSLLIQIERVFNQTAGTDTYINQKKYTFSMKANVYRKVDTAALETKKAYQFFSQFEQQMLSVTKYYTAILNYAANESVLGNNDSAFQLTKMAAQLVEEFSDVQFLKPEILINNYAISGYISGKLPIETCISTLIAFEAQIGEFADTLLICNNLVSFYALSGQWEKANHLASVLHLRVADNPDIDDYYKYFIVNNYAVIRYLLGHVEEARPMISSLSELIPLENDKVYFNVRTKLLYNFISTEDTLPLIDNWNDALITKHPLQVGRAWEFWGKLLLFSELQNWSDC